MHCLYFIGEREFYARKNYATLEITFMQTAKVKGNKQLKAPQNHSYERS